MMKYSDYCRRREAEAREQAEYYERTPEDAQKAAGAREQREAEALWATLAEKAEAVEAAEAAAAEKAEKKAEAVRRQPEHLDAKLIKIDRNGSKHYEGRVKCDRCNGRGEYWWGAMINGRPQYSGVCFKCGGARYVPGKWIERTPEYQAELDAKREAKRAAEQARLDRERAEREAAEAQRKAEREARLQALRAISQHVGTVGERLRLEVTYTGSADFEVKSFTGYGTTTMYIHRFKDAAGDLLIWKTNSALHLAEDTPVRLTGTVKEHGEYKGEKQTVLTRCKVEELRPAERPAREPEPDYGPSNPWGAPGMQVSDFISGARPW